MDSEEEKLGAGDIQDLLDKANSGDKNAADEGADQPTGAATAAGSPGTSTEEISVEDRATQLLDEVDAGLEAAVTGAPMKGRNGRAEADDAKPFEFAEFGSDSDGENEKAFSIGMLDDVQMSVQIELGRAELLIDEVMSMRKGVVVPLDKLAGDPIDIVVNGRLLARGEVLVLNDKFCVRVVEIVSADS